MPLVCDHSEFGGIFSLFISNSSIPIALSFFFAFYLTIFETYVASEASGGETSDSVLCIVIGCECY